MVKLLTDDKSNMKLAKNSKYNFKYKTVMLSLMHGNTYFEAIGKRGTLCANLTKGCLESCIGNSGFNSMPSVKNAKFQRTDLYFKDLPRFMSLLTCEIGLHEALALKVGHRLACRPNGFSDVPWELKRDIEGDTIFDLFPNVQFYDYTKSFKRALTLDLHNYDLTYSFNENTKFDQFYELMDAGKKVSVVFRDRIPKEFLGYPVQDGTTHDLTFLRRPGVLGLKAIGKGRSDKTGFVLDY